MASGYFDGEDYLHVSRPLFLVKVTTYILCQKTLMMKITRMFLGLVSLLTRVPCSCSLLQSDLDQIWAEAKVSIVLGFWLSLMPMPDLQTTSQSPLSLSVVQFFSFFKISVMTRPDLRENDCGEDGCGEGDCGEDDCGENDCGEDDCGEENVGRMTVGRMTVERRCLSHRRRPRVQASAAAANPRKSPSSFLELLLQIQIP